MRILGIDPGSSRIGYALIENPKKPILIEYGVLEIKAKTLAEKLLILSNDFNCLLEKLKPDAAGIEKLYFMKNVKTGIEVAQARGVLLLLMLKKNIPVVELDPTRIKQLITGYGLSDKESVAKMVRMILKIDKLEGYDDATDAIAIAIVTSLSYNHPYY